MKKFISMLLSTLLALTLLTGCGGSSEITADNYFDEPITFLVHAGAGGNLDIKVRIVAKYLEEQTGQTMIVENLAGAGGATAAVEYLKEEPNSRKILVLGDAMFSIVPHTAEVTFTKEDYAPFIGLDSVKAGLFVDPNIYPDLDSYIAAGTDGEVIFADNGKASGSFLAPAMLHEAAGLNYQGLTVDSAAEGLTNVYAGHVDAAWASMGLGEQYVNEGTLIPLVTFAPEAYTYDNGTVIPSCIELGIDVTHQNFLYFGLRSGSDEALLDMLYNEFNTVYQNEEFIAEMDNAGVTLLPLDAEGIDEFVNKSISDISNYYESNQ